ncbi:3-oxoacid CoA-transferase subunit A/glutaconate CoA-transferase subunit A [Halobiforma haloterrestris]|uniref:3-oxoacid CoA-transferase subunit A/glutaconate CoA-transferase subunit A n=1 Tax=Natronobacterium haloterrestre TaxID=148448 RepID=A0A1I1JHZ5_NATHA|nr:CoA-transferase [Halobiforma haloterrestris]SFC45060.1 3-oxoacid CoA-transferase subunit A/glutaconate CoA-transferase subunit A [Halobiforma haloterrestris]
MNVHAEGDGELVGWEHPDEVRRWNRENRTRAYEDKRMSAAEAVDRYVDDGDVVASGGFGHVRISTPVLHEIVRQGIEDLTLMGKTTVFDADLLIAAGAVSRVENAYCFAHETRGLAPAGRRKVENGEVEVVSEASNATLQWRFLAAKMGVPFVPTRILNGTDTFEKSSAKVVEDPWSGDPVTLVPACYPDAVCIHVDKADKYGNAVIEGIGVEDPQLAGAAKRLIVTAEEIVDDEELRDRPKDVEIPFFQVDAVVEAPYGSHPGEMPYHYYFDDDHLEEWMELTETEEGTQEYLETYVTGTDDFEEYLEAVGGAERLAELEAIENYERPESGGPEGGDRA